jgi:tRNA 2-selenouridine synthase
MIEEVESLIKKRQTNNGKLTTNNLLVHCWRGGMRSSGVAWLLDLYGFKVYTLVGGYKAYRKWALAQFEKEYSFNIIGGYTGSGKTLLIHELIKQQKNVIDLEELANHKGSAFGAVGQQPKQEMFENKLAQALSSTEHTANGQQPTAIYLEDESQRIGNIQIPMPLWYSMRKSPVYFIDIPFKERLNFITEEYSRIRKEQLINAIIRIQKRLGGLETKNAINYLQEDNYTECFRILLKYYDKWYDKALANRENLSSLLNKIPCSGVDTKTNIQKLLSCPTVHV